MLIISFKRYGKIIFTLDQLTVHVITKLFGLSPSPLTLSGFLWGTSGGVEHMSEWEDG